MSHHRLTVLPADLHVVHILLPQELLPRSAILSLVQGRLVYWCSRMRRGLDHNNSVFLVLHLAILQSEFLDNNSLALVWKLVALSVDVSVVTMSDDFAARKLDFSSGEKLSLLNVEVFEGFLSSLATLSGGSSDDLLDCRRVSGARLWPLVLCNTARAISNYLERFGQVIAACLGSRVDD